jgi:PAS domain S-box-containing protein
VELSGYIVEPLREDHEFVLCRGRPKEEGAPSILLLVPASKRPAPESLKKLEREFSLRDELDAAWAVRPLALSQYNEQKVLVFENPGGEPLDLLIQGPMPLRQFLRFAIGLAAALRELHNRNLIHKDLKPANVLVDPVTGRAWLTGFAIASRLPRERQSPEPPEFIAGTLPYMAPEQTGRMNRSIDSRSDLYSLGVTFYEMLTGTLPFDASDPMEWVHCHIARQPPPPGKRLNNIPGPVTAIILKLLAKTAEERYQTAAGVESDLQHCLAEWEATDYVKDFPLGRQDTPTQLLIPEKLYGRTEDIQKLGFAFDRVVAGGTPELVLVSGYSGVGKSSVVNELHKLLVPPRGLFVSGKFDQYKRDIPYATLAQAFQSLVRQLLSKKESELSHWRDALHQALDPNGRLIADLVPELNLILGEQPPVPELSPQDTQARFHLVFRRFVGVFARPEHPLALFLDDLQWLDAATLDVLEYLLVRTDVRHLLLLGAYRDNEVTSDHPLMRRIEFIRKAGTTVSDIVLAPLTGEALGQLIADSLHCAREHAYPLADLVHEKTGGNPFFSIQFLYALVEEALLTCDRITGLWNWDLNRIRAKGFTDNVVGLMVEKLNRLPPGTTDSLKHFACLGNAVEFSTLRLVYQDANETFHDNLWEAVRAGLLFRSENSYSFLHDRVQEAAYSLIPESARPAAHLQIGRILAAQTPRAHREEQIFEIVNHLNRGSALILSTEEREQLAELNLLAAKRAKDSTAYAAALSYLLAGTALLGQNVWERRHDLTFAFEWHRAECEFLTGDSLAAEARLTSLSARAANTVELAGVAGLRMDLYTALAQSDRAVDVCLEYLRKIGIDWSSTPLEEQARGEYERVLSQLGNRAIEALQDLPLMTDASQLATLDVLAKVLPPAMFRDANLGAMVTCRAVNLTLEYGVCDASCFAFVYLGMMAGPQFAEYDAGFRFGQLGYDLVEKRGLKRLQARAELCFSNHVMPWRKPVRECRALIRRTFETAERSGDLCFAAYSCNNLITNLLAAGEPLAEVQREAEKALQFAQNARVGPVVDIVAGQLALIRTLRGLTSSFGSFSGAEFDELQFENHLAEDPAALPECFYWIRKLQARFFAGDFVSALYAASQAERLLWTAPSNLEIAEYHLYDALARAASWDTAPSELRQLHCEALAAHNNQLKIWAEHCPENFECRALLVGAEIARIEGRLLEAEHLYERAIRSARDNDFVHVEAVANETASCFYLARGFETIGYAYLRDARYAFLRWGAGGKLSQLDRLYPHLREEKPAPRLASTIEAPVEHLDLATVIKVSQALSAEIVPAKLIDTLMRTAIEQAGAESGVLILSHGGEERVAAQAATGNGGVVVRLEGAPISTVPESVLQFVVRTRDFVILEDAAVINHSFSSDPYIRDHHPRSVLCLPLITQGKLIGALYLENNLAPRVFTPARITVLKLLAAQAAISLENTRLYSDLEHREARFRRLVDANVMGIFIWNLSGKITEANEAFLRMLGYSREDLSSGRMRWMDLTPPEWSDLDAMAVIDLEQSGTVRPYEKEFFRKQGGRLPVLVGGALFEQGGSEGVAFVLDLTEQKRAEEALHRSQNYLAEAQRLTHTGSCAIDGQSRETLYWSEEMFRLFGFDPQQGLPMWDQWLQRIHQEDRDKFRMAGDRTFLEKVDCDVEFRTVKSDGTIKHIHAIGHPVLNLNGELVQVVGTMVDVTERRRAEEALRRSEAYLAEAQTLTHTGSWAWQLPGRDNVHLSEEWYRVFGFNPEAGMPPWEARFQRVHPEDRIKWQGAIERAIQEKTDYDIKFRILLPDGTLKWVHTVGHPVLNGSGDLVQFVGTSTDITERKHAEEALRRSEAYLAESQRLTLTGSWASHATTYEALYWSEEMFRVFGFDPQQGLPMRDQWLQRIHPEDRDKVKQQASDRMFLQKVNSDLEFRIVLPDGTIKHIHGLAHPVLGPNGELVEVVGTVVDITERKRAENERERLRQAQADLAHVNRVNTMGELTASLAHEIKQPIAAAVTNARTYMRWLAREQPNLAEAQEAATRLINDVTRASDIISRISSLFKKETAQREFVNVNELVLEMVALVRTEAARYSISVQTDLAPALPQVLADRVQLQQVFMNLMLNGIEAMKDLETPGRLTIISRQMENHQLQISVSDTGVGLPAETPEKIFEAFVTSKSQGTGMGLPISRSIIESHGGRLWATPNAGPGATFQFTLPLEARAHQTA